MTRKRKSPDTTAPAHVPDHCRRGVLVFLRAPVKGHWILSLVPDRAFESHRASGEPLQQSRMGKETAVGCTEGKRRKRRSSTPAEFPFAVEDGLPKGPRCTYLPARYQIRPPATSCPPAPGCSPERNNCASFGCQRTRRDLCPLTWRRCQHRSGWGLC